MTPAEVIEMRDELAAQLGEDFALTTESDWRWIADWLISSGWVVAPPKNKGENVDSGC